MGFPSISLYRWVSCAHFTFWLCVQRMQQVVRSALSAKEDATDESDVMEAWISLGGTHNWFLINRASPLHSIRRVAWQNWVYQSRKTQRCLFWIRTCRWPHQLGMPFTLLYLNILHHTSCVQLASAADSEGADYQTFKALLKWRKSLNIFRSTNKIVCALLLKRRWCIYSTTIPLLVLTSN